MVDAACARDGAGEDSGGGDSGAGRTPEATIRAMDDAVSEALAALEAVEVLAERVDAAASRAGATGVPSLGLLAAVRCLRAHLDTVDARLTADGG